MITSTLDILYLALAIGFILLVIFLCVTLIFVILILKDANKISRKARETVELVSNYVIIPAKAIASLGGKVESIVEFIQKKIEKEYKKRK